MLSRLILTCYQNTKYYLFIFNTFSPLLGISLVSGLSELARDRETGGISAYYKIAIIRIMYKYVFWYSGIIVTIVFKLCPLLLLHILTRHAFLTYLTFSFV